MKLTGFEALSFDCYGTLIDWEAGLSAVLDPWAQARGLGLAGEQLLTEYSAAEAAAEADHPADRYPYILARSMRLLGDRLGAEVTDEQAARLASSVPQWPAFGDSHDALVTLRKRAKLIILSNVDRARSRHRMPGSGSSSPASSPRRTSGRTSRPSGTSTRSPPRRPGWASNPAGCCMWRRACSTTTCPPSGRACPRCGSTGGTPGPAGAPPHSHRRR